MARHFVCLFYHPSPRIPDLHWLSYQPSPRIPDLHFYLPQNGSLYLSWPFRWCDGGGLVTRWQASRLGKQ